MKNLDQFNFFTEETTAKESDVFTSSYNGNVIELEVDGTHTGLNMSILATMTKDGLYKTQTAFNQSDLYKTTINITTNGMYMIPTAGLSYIKLSINSITGGNVSVLGRLLG